MAGQEDENPPEPAPADKPDDANQALGTSPPPKATAGTPDDQSGKAEAESDLIQSVDLSSEDDPKKIVGYGSYKALSPPDDLKLVDVNLQDQTRERVTLWLIGILLFLIVLSFTALFTDQIERAAGFENDEFFKNLESLVDKLLGPVIALLSTAVGFYFGSKVATSGGSNPQKKP